MISKLALLWDLHQTLLCCESCSHRLLQVPAQAAVPPLQVEARAQPAPSPCA